MTSIAKELNTELEEIRQYLIDYLGNIGFNEIPSIKQFFQSLTKEGNKVYIINFNYTNSVNQYFAPELLKNQVIINSVHGSLEKGGIVFGYGNDQDSNYHTLKALEINEFLKHLKTFEYGVNDNYQRVYSELLGIKGEFEVHVLGHSLSNTDKTLLQEIMDSDECFRINFYKRSDLEPKEQLLAYKELYYAASRIVEDERTIRKKIVPFNNSEIFASKDT